MESAAVIRGHELPKMNDSELGGLFRSCWGGRLEDRAWPTSPGGHRECSPPGTPEEPGCGHWRQRRLPAWPYWFMGGARGCTAGGQHGCQSPSRFVRPRNWLSGAQIQSGKRVNHGQWEASRATSSRLELHAAGTRRAFGCVVGRNRRATGADPDSGGWCVPSRERRCA